MYIPMQACRVQVLIKTEGILDFEIQDLSKNINKKRLHEVKMLRYSQQIPEEELEAILIDVLTTGNLVMKLQTAGWFSQGVLFLIFRNYFLYN